MTRSTSGWTFALLALVFFTAGCGVDDEPLRPRVGQSKSNLSAMSLEERLAATESQDQAAPQVFEREGAAPEAAVAEYRACREGLLAERSYINANGMTRLIMVVNCMKEKGWTVKEGVDPGAAGS
jgi:hypothetical protein